MKGSDIEIGAEYAIAVPANKYRHAVRAKIVAVGQRGERYSQARGHAEFEPLDDPEQAETGGPSAMPEAHKYRVTIAADGLPKARRYGRAPAPEEGDRVAHLAPHGNVIDPWDVFMEHRREALLRDAQVHDVNRRGREHLKATAVALADLAGIEAGSGYSGGGIRISTSGAAKLIERLGGTAPKCEPRPERFAELFETGKEPN